MVLVNKRLKELRAAHGLTQEGLAQAVSIERSSIGKYESMNKPVTPPPDVLMRFANFFGVTVDYLLGREDASAPPSTPTKIGFISSMYDIIVLKSCL